MRISGQTRDTLNALETHYPALAAMEETAKSRLVQSSTWFDFPKGTELFAPGKACQGYLLLCNGVVRVQSVSKEGREALLYRVVPGEICVQTSLCLLGDETYSAEAISESAVGGVLLDPTSFDQLLEQSGSFRQFVFSAIASRLRDMTVAVERIAFHSIEARLADALLTRQDDAGEVRVTHGDLARDMATAREVVSRQLERLAQKGLVETRRGSILILNYEALGRLAF